MVLIKFPKKPVSSNKSDLTQNTTPQGNDQAIQMNGMAETNIPKPFIDKLTVNLTFHSAKQAYETHGVLYQSLTGDTEDFPSVGKAVKGFKIAKKIMLPDCESYPRIDYSFTTDQSTGANIGQRVRIEFNPAKLGLAGLEYLHNVLSSVIEGGWHEFVTHGRISRLDVAVDLVDVRITKLKMVPKKAVVSQTWNNSKGKLETYQWGKPTGSYTQIYNKTAEMAARGAVVSGPQVTRFERRLKQPACKTLTKLTELENPFAGFVLTNAMPPAPQGGNKDHMWPLFCDSVSVRGLHAALQLVSEHKRPEYKKRFANAAPGWWNPDAIWAQWPVIVQQSKIGDPKAWA